MSGAPPRADPAVPHSTRGGTATLLLPDLVAGLSCAGLLLPEAMAYAGVAGLPPAAGIVAATVGPLVYGVLGLSRYALVAATSSSAIVIAAAIRALQPVGPHAALVLTATLVGLCGLLFLLCGLLRLGGIAHFIARPVVRGLAFGLAIVISLRQLASLAGVTPTPGSTLHLAVELVRTVPHWDGFSLAYGAATLLLLAVLSRWPRLPAMLLTIVAAIAGNLLLARAGHALPVVGPVHFSIPQPELPAQSLTRWLHLAEVAGALTLILFAESYGSIRSFALWHDDRVDANRELLALGAANLASAALQGLPVGAGYSATAANAAAGAQTRAASLWAGAFVAAAALGLSHYTALIPQAVLAAVILFAMRHALQLTPLRRYFQWRRDRVVVAVAVVAVLALGVLEGLLAAIAVSLALLIQALAQPGLTRLGRLGDSHDYVALSAHTDARPVPGMLILRPEAPLFFANVSELLEQARTAVLHESAAQMLVLSLEETPDVDGTAIEALGQFAARLRADGRQLLLARLKPPVCLALERCGLEALRAAVLSEDSVATVVALAGQRGATDATR